MPHTKTNLFHHLCRNLTLSRTNWPTLFYFRFVLFSIWKGILYYLETKTFRLGPKTTQRTTNPFKPTFPCKPSDSRQKAVKNKRTLETSHIFQTLKFTHSWPQQQTEVNNNNSTDQDSKNEPRWEDFIFTKVWQLFGKLKTRKNKKPSKSSRWNPLCFWTN